MDIPSRFRSKIGVYEIQISGVDIRATIVDRDDQLEKGLSELKSLMGDLPLVGVDFKGSRNVTRKGLRVPNLLLLYVKNLCLIIQLINVIPFEEKLGQFLSDKSICFVGYEIDSHFSALRDYHIRVFPKCVTSEDFMAGDGAEIRYLAASTLKIPSLQSCCGVVELANKIGFDAEEADKAMEKTDWGASIFSEEEVKYAVHDVHHCYYVGEKLLRMLG